MFTETNLLLWRHKFQFFELYVWLLHSKFIKHVIFYSEDDFSYCQFCKMGIRASITVQSSGKTKVVKITALHSSKTICK